MRKIGVGCSINDIKEDEDNDVGYIYMMEIGVGCSINNT